jgi:hypothetical protein
MPERAPMQTPEPHARRESLMRVIESELDRHPELEQDFALRTISVIVVLHERTGRPVRIMLRTEGQRDLHERPHAVDQ